MTSAGRVRIPGLVGLAFGLLLLSGAAAAAQPGFSFAGTPGRLPKAVVPTHYAIELQPDLENLTLAGSEVVDIEVLQPTDRLVLNAVNMTVDAASLDGTPELPAITLDAAAGTVTLAFARPIAVGAHKLRLRFNAHVNRFGRGLFVVDYPTDQGRKRMISSHLEPADARRIFPCWDEPAFKATFALTVTVPQQFLAVSNMPVSREEPVGGALKRISFEPTPKMSSYLFVLAAGELERLSGAADGVTINVITTLGKSRHGRYALDSAIELMGYFNDYFAAKYPLPKLDLIAVPGGFGGAMENWGGITFFESRLLFDPASNPPEARRGIYAILAHEMAHQWFGNLVTMAWWDDLWLNEGFASWMQTKSADHFNPDWQVWLNNSAKQRAMSADARRTTRPIQQPVANETEAMAVFDTITYSKGQAFIRMLESYLGEDVFRAGIRRYMREHAYSNATTADLWRALQAASGKPVATIAASYTEQAGLPVIVGQATCAGDRQSARLRQERFTIRDPDAKPQRWQVPIAIGPFRAMPQGGPALLSDETMEVAAGRCGEPVTLNAGDIGYYRVQYDGAMLAALIAEMASLAPADQVNLLADSWALVEAGRIEPARFFELIDKLDGNEPRAVWEQVAGILGRIDHLQWDRPARPAFQAYAKARLRPIFDRLGWNAVAGEPADRGLLRERLVRALGDLGDQDIIGEAKRRFAAFLADPDSLPLALRAPVTRLAGRNADRATYEALKALARRTTDTDERVRYYSALASALDPTLAGETLAIALTDELPTNMVGSLFYWVAWDGEHADLAWTFIKSNFSALAAKQGPYFRSYFASDFMTIFSDAGRAAELAAFAPVQETSGGRMVAERGRESILTDADFVARRLPAVDAWVHRYGARR
jgi:aminopeptidase N